MDRKPFTPKAYLKVDCPFSFKYLLFMAEAGLLDRIKVIRCDPESAGFEGVKVKLAAATNEPATFPTVEVEPGRYRTDSGQYLQSIGTGLRRENHAARPFTAPGFGGAFSSGRFCDLSVT